MKYQITSDNMDLTPSMESLVKEKFERVENKIRDFDDATKYVRVVMNTAPDGMFTVKVELMVNGRKYYSDETDFSLEGALIKCVEEIFNMLEKEKTHQERRRKDKLDVVIEELKSEEIEENSEEQ